MEVVLSSMVCLGSLGESGGLEDPSNFVLQWEISREWDRWVGDTQLPGWIGTSGPERVIRDPKPHRVLSLRNYVLATIPVHPLIISEFVSTIRHNIDRRNRSW